jgi:hypothetical protein
MGEKSDAPQRLLLSLAHGARAACSGTQIAMEMGVNGAHRGRLGAMMCLEGVSMSGVNRFQRLAVASIKYGVLALTLIVAACSAHGGVSAG